MGQPHHGEIVVPRGALLGAAAVIVLSVGLAAGARQVRLAHPAPPLGPPLAQVEVRFADRADGAILMLDADSGRELAVVPSGEGGFVRGVLRGMFRTRKLESMGKEGRFRLAREHNRRLTLEDPQTGRRIDLDSFGPSNSAAFARLLEAGTAATNADSAVHAAAEKSVP